MVQRALDPPPPHTHTHIHTHSPPPPHSVLSADGSTLLTYKMLSCKGRPNTSTVHSSIVLQLSMTIPSTNCHRWSAIYCLMNSQLSLKQNNNQHRSSDKAPGSDAIPAEIYKAEGLPVTETLTKWAASSEFGTFRLCEQRWFRRACASAQSRQNLNLLAHISSESRGTFRQKAKSLAPLNGWACIVTICYDGMLEDTNSLDGAQIVSLRVEEGGVWRKVAIHQYFKHASIIHLYKGKGTAQVCENRRDISVLDICKNPTESPK